MSFNASCIVPGVFLIGFSGFAMAWDTPRNPDLRPSFGFRAGGSNDVGALDDISKSGAQESRDVENQNLDFSTDALFPLINAWSLQAGAGMTSNLNKSDESTLASASSLDTAMVNAFLSSR